MQLLARLMDHALAARGERTTIVVATSGDTGGAAVEAFRGRERADLFVLFPHGRVSDVQRRMMTTAQRRQRPCARGRRHLRRLPGAGEGPVQPSRLPRPGAAVGRQLDQLGAHRRAGGLLLHRRGDARRAASQGRRSPCRPAISATSSRATSPQRMGLPIDRLVIATNVNDILARTLATGTYDVREVVATSSPSMDIQVSSNFERLLFEAYRPRCRGRSAPDGFAGAIAGASRCPREALSRIRALFNADRADEDETAATIRTTLARDLAPGRSAHRGRPCRRGKGNARSGGADDRARHRASGQVPGRRRGRLRRAPGLAGLAFRLT